MTIVYVVSFAHIDSCDSVHYNELTKFDVLAVYGSYEAAVQRLDKEAKHFNEEWMREMENEIKNLDISYYPEYETNWKGEYWSGYHYDPYHDPHQKIINGAIRTPTSITRIIRFIEDDEVKDGGKPFAEYIIKIDAKIIE